MTRASHSYNHLSVYAIDVLVRCFFLLALFILPTQFARAQSLAPRAYVITPSNANAITFTWSYYDGGLNFNGAVPISNAKGTYNLPILSYYHSFNFFGRSANVTAFLPYGVGNFTGDVGGANRQVYRSGLLDFTVRFSVNLMGGPNMKLPEFVKWKQKRLLGASVLLVSPTGQYNPNHLVNWGINRWAVKPELGYSERWGHWVLDAYGGVWFYTSNDAFFSIPHPLPQTEAPIGSVETHLSYDFDKFRCWASIDGNFWAGGATSLNGIPNPKTQQTSSRIGATFSLPIFKHQSIKVSYSNGTYIRFGGNYQNVSLAWQYSWVGWPDFHSH